ncbi:metallophosphoesterase [Gracilibacillus oryzae]|uniref:Metallophosphoesterase n=1 Tax=Gracilibacillus oryzae TaxID=1672701 RepID=A0A7C8KRW2_9BACI|nr:metallophosphoesterase [Gracilibacillus oryzae]KAB8138592.1 metallophosphoesterase [Gracilibacillus oryzae]
MNRRTFLKRMIGGIISIFGIGGGTYYYAKEIEPKLLDIHHVPIQSPNIPAGFDSYKILQFSDTHLGFHYSIEQLKELVKEINAMNPDVITFTGDLVDHPQEFSWDNQIVSTLSSMSAPDGKYWIYGNHDHGGYGTDIVKQVFDNAGFQLLKNSHSLLERNGDKIMLAGLDDIMLGQPDTEAAIQSEEKIDFTILLVHEPDYADTVKDYDIDVQISGHSHGGQVQMPLLGYIYTPYLAEKYVEGYYQVGTRPLQLYVSRGIGTTRLPYRFLCKPEVTLYELKKG